MKALFLLLGSLLIALGFFYLNRPSKIFKIHRWLRETVLNDAYINLHRKKIASLLVLIALILIALATF